MSDLPGKSQPVFKGDGAWVGGYHAAGGKGEYRGGGFRCYPAKEGQSAGGLFCTGAWSFPFSGILP